MAANNARKTSTYDATVGDGGFVIRRDGVPLKTPAGNVLTVPSSALAQAIAEEWRAQGAKTNHAAMPITQLAATAIDIVAKERGKIIDEIAAYAESELLCHRAEEPKDLAVRQEHLWQPLLDWCAKRFKAKLKAGTGIVPIKQTQDAVKNLRRAVEAHDNFHLAGLQQAVHVSGSLILGLALAESHTEAAQAFEAAELDTLFQIEKWGDDPAAQAALNQKRQDLKLCESWFKLIACKQPAA